MIQELLAITDPQIDKIIVLLGRMIDHIPAILTMCGTLFLIIRQFLNKREISEKIDKNTEVSVKAFDAANGHNEKIAAAVKLSEEVLTTIKKS